MSQTLLYRLINAFFPCHSFQQLNLAAICDMTKGNDDIIFLEIY